jgi:hypothetical protein
MATARLNEPVSRTPFSISARTFVRLVVTVWSYAL